MARAAPASPTFHLQLPLPLLRSSQHPQQTEASPLLPVGGSQDGFAMLPSSGKESNFNQTVAAIGRTVLWHHCQDMALHRMHMPGSVSVLLIHPYNCLKKQVLLSPFYR